MCETSRLNFSDLWPLFLNWTLKRTPELSHTQGLIDIAETTMRKNGVRTEVLRPVGFGIA